ncbi:lysophospholipase [Planomonospora parontospora subsp. parontospora]|uniref:Lysophospholipase n=2 Tax=Planomonospora parontospora TaxID=58119 RepID=A0AA37BK51_9ACTN|nr:alpha/beta fold hydrolase [Planomonospora parontospora]GGK82668.1 lysophospholipase [Planomonospora parontospora]GII12199.1 lysophospholipase [Planomonospora parontospora subsp. parontospora]
MAQETGRRFDGVRQPIHLHVWPHPSPAYVAVFVHGYADHAGRYGHVANALVRHGAAVYAPDHMGSGLSGGRPALVEDYEEVVADLRTVVGQARADHPGRPVVMIGHSVGGTVATRYAQRHADDLSALVLVAPVLGAWSTATSLLAFEEIPEMPLDVGAVMSRDPQEARRYNEDPLIWHGAFVRRTLEAIAASLERIDRGGSLLFLPVLWLHGDADMLARLEESRAGIERIRGAYLTERIYPGVPHGIFHDVEKEHAIADTTAFIESALTLIGDSGR